MLIDRNKDIFRRYIEEVWKDENLDIADEVFAEKYLSHQSDGTAPERYSLTNFLSSDSGLHP